MRKRGTQPKTSGGAAPARRAADAADRSDSFPIVGIGASAGGLEAFASLLSNVPGDPGVAFVLVQHLDPKHESLLTEILHRSTTMPVSEVTEGVRVKPNHVYVIPPNKDLAISRSILHLMPRTYTRRQHMPVDVFLRSLAEDQKNKAIGVVLSGTASDGVLGLKAIKAEGGITLAQDESSAKYSGMPRSAAAAGVVDFVLPPEDIARELGRIGRHPYLTSPKAVTSEGLLPESGGSLTKIFTLLRGAFGTDFTHYKDTTIRRRIKRRMVLHKIEEPEIYIRQLRDHPGEVEALYHDILINVTSFLRDPSTFEALKSIIFPSIVDNRPSKTPIRIWVPGCATGEEAYSITICLLEFLSARRLTVPVQIFGTDVSQSAIERARAGRYPENITLDVSPDRLRRFFVRVEGGEYQISRSVRDLCVFAQHDLIKDPPFSRLDLISCRNLLIYLGTVMQGRILLMCHYALKPHGLLILGTSETVGNYTRHFHLLDKKSKIYERKETTARSRLDMALAQGASGSTIPSDKKLGGRIKPEFDPLKEADRIVQSKYAPAGVLISDEMEVLQFRGHTSTYLEPAPGAPSLNLMKMAREGLLPELRAAMRQARKENGPARREEVRIKTNSRTRTINLEVHPIRGPRQTDQFFLVLFEEVPGPLVEIPAQQRPAPEAAKARGSAEKREIADLGRELADAKEYLQSVVQDQEATNEELKSANEEILSSNEELQSTNEELETAKEELQSSNEELTTLNEELQNRNLELSQVNNDLLNLLSSINIPVVMLSPDLRIRRFTPQAEKALNLIQSDVGRPISDIRLNIDLVGLDQLILDTIDKVSVKQLDVKDRDGRWYSLWIRPYRTSDNKIDGAILALVDVNALKQHTAELAAATAKLQAEAIDRTRSEQRFKLAVDSAPNAIVMFSQSGAILLVNAQTEILFGYGRDELMGMSMETLVPERFRHNHPENRKGFFAESGATPTAGRLDLFALRKDGSEVPVEIGLNPIETDEGTCVLSAIVDISERKRTEEALRKSHEELEIHVQRRTTELNQALRALQVEVAERRHAEDALAAGERRYRELFENASDIVYTTDLEGNFISINRAAEEVLGYTREEAARLNLAQITTPDQLAVGHRMLGQRLVGGAIQFEMLVRARDGRSISLEIRSRQIHEHDRPVGVQWIARDITERKRIEEDRRELSARLNRLQEEERRRLAHELHDTTAQNLVALKMNLGAVQEGLAGPDPKLRQTLAESQELADQCLREVRTLSYQLHPPMLDERGLASALRVYTEGFAERSGIAVDLDIAEEFGRLPQEVELTGFRVVQECLTNVHRHSESPTARIHVGRTDSAVTLEVSAAGHGFQASSPEALRDAEDRGIGIRGMRERVRQLGGSLEIDSSPSGTLVRTVLPLHQDSSST